MAAGLAGGSADGAAVLVALNTIFENVLSEDELCCLGSKLGADVPFCIVCGSMYCEGIGDQLSKFVPLPKDTCIVVACGGEGVSTPEAYRSLDVDYDNFSSYNKKGVSELESKMISQDISFCDKFFNIFEKTIAEQRPIVNEIKRIMDECGARRSMMSGSGPSVFGVFLSVEDAKKAVLEISKSGYFSVLSYPVFERK